MTKQYEDFCYPEGRFTGPYSRQQALELLEESDEQLYGIDYVKLRRRIEDALRKTATHEQLEKIAKILNVKL